MVMDSIMHTRTFAVNYNELLKWGFPICLSTKSDGSFRKCIIEMIMTGRLKWSWLSGNLVWLPGNQRTPGFYSMVLWRIVFINGQFSQQREIAQKSKMWRMEDLWIHLSWDEAAWILKAVLAGSSVRPQNSATLFTYLLCLGGETALS